MFKSSNYAQIRCLDCKTVIHIYPDDAFEDLECECSADATLEELRQQAKDKNIKGASQMGREKLISKLKEA